MLAQALLGNRVFRYASGAAVLALAISIAIYAWLVSFGSVASPDWLQSAFALTWGAFLLTSSACLILGARIVVKHTSPSESPGRAAVIEIFRRLLIGVCAPTAMLIVCLYILVSGARGEAEGHRATFVFWISFVAVPSVALANCWVLFRAWPRSWRLFGAGSLLPLGYGVLAVVAVAGSGHLAGLVAGVILWPFALILGLMTPPSAVMASLAVALIAPVIVFCAAVAREWRRLDSSRSSIQSSSAPPGANS